MHGLMTELFQDGAVSDRPPSFMTQIGKLIKREIANIRRSRAVTIARIVQSTVLGVLVGVIFFRVGSLPPDKAQNLQSHFGAIVIVSTIVMMGPAQAAYVLAFFLFTVTLTPLPGFSHSLKSDPFSSENILQITMP